MSIVPPCCSCSSTADPPCWSCFSTIVLTLTNPCYSWGTRSQSVASLGKHALQLLIRLADFSLQRFSLGNLHFNWCSLEFLAFLNPPFFGSWSGSQSTVNPREFSPINHPFVFKILKLCKGPPWRDSNPFLVRTCFSEAGFIVVKTLVSFNILPTCGSFFWKPFAQSVQTKESEHLITQTCEHQTWNPHLMIMFHPQKKICSIGACCKSWNTQIWQRPTFRLRYF